MQPATGSSAKQYDTVALAVRVFVGGALETLFAVGLLTYVAPHIIIYNITMNQSVIITNLFRSDVLPTFILLLIATILTPLFLSFVLTKREPELRIVPPLWMMVIASVWTLIECRSIFTLDNIPFYGIGLTFLVFLGFVEDYGITSMVGIPSDRAYLYFA